MQVVFFTLTVATPPANEKAPEQVGGRVMTSKTDQ